MFRLLRAASIASALAAMALGPNRVLAGAQASLSISPQPIRIGAFAVITGSNLKPGRFYTFLLAASGPNKPGTRAFIQTLGRANASGGLRVRVKIPVVVRCGHATLFATAGRSTVATTVTVRGCKAGAKSGGPPPPPKPH